jgi:hypothetical protein
MNAPAMRLADYWMGRNETHADDLTAEIVRNATHLLRRVNNLLVLMHDIQIEPHPITGNPITSGWRPPEINAGTKGAAPRSKHMSGNAVDLYDPDGEIDAWCMDHLDFLAEAGLWLEHPSATKGWCHLQQVPPKSGRRVFYP